MRQLLPQHLVVLVFVVVVSGVNLNTSVGSLLVRDDITPPLVVVDAQCNQKEAAWGPPEAQHSGGATTAHGEDVVAIHLAPVCSIGVMPACLLHNAEPVAGLGLDDPHVDGVRHGDELKRKLCGKWMTSNGSKEYVLLWDWRWWVKVEAGRSECCDEGAVYVGSGKGGKDQAACGWRDFFINKNTSEFVDWLCQNLFLLFIGLWQMHTCFPYGIGTTVFACTEVMWTKVHVEDYHFLNIANWTPSVLTWRHGTYACVYPTVSTIAATSSPFLT